MKIIKTNLTHEEFIKLMCPPRPAGPDTTKDVYRDGVFIGHPIEDGSGNVVGNVPVDGDWIHWRTSDGMTIVYPVMDIWGR